MIFLLPIDYKYGQSCRTLLVLKLLLVRLLLLVSYLSYTCYVNGGENIAETLVSFMRLRGHCSTQGLHQVSESRL